MENEPITVTLTLQQWDIVLAVISSAPFNAVTRANEALVALQSQTSQQFEAAAKKYKDAAPADGGQVPEDAAA